MSLVAVDAKSITKVFGDIGASNDLSFAQGEGGFRTHRTQRSRKNNPTPPLPRCPIAYQLHLPARFHTICSDVCRHQRLITLAEVSAPRHSFYAARPSLESSHRRRLHTVIFGIIYVAAFTIIIMYIAFRLFATEKILTAKLKFRGLRKHRNDNADRRE